MNLCFHLYEDNQSSVTDGSRDEVQLPRRTFDPIVVGHGDHIV